MSMHSKGKGKCFHSDFTKLLAHVGTPFLFFKWHCGWTLFGKYTTGLWPGRDADLSPPSSAEVKNRVELYLCSP